MTKALLKLWTNPSNRSKPFSIRRELKNVDKTLCKQKPPHEFTRSPRSITGDLNYWKASEFRTWLLFYSLPLLLHILPPLYLHHFALLVCAMHILLSKQITDMECGAAEEMLLDFYNLLPELYGVHSCTMNAHSLTHPCWTHSAFSFESHNGHLKRAVNSNRQVADQLSSHIDVQIMLQKLYSEIEKKESESCLNFLEFNRHSSTMTKLTYGYAIGSIKICTLTDVELNAARDIDPSIQQRVQKFEKILISNIVLHTKCFDEKNKESKRNSYYCCFRDLNNKEQFGAIEGFAESTQIGAIAFIKVFMVTENSILKASGRPCRQILDEYESFSLISQFIIEVLPIDYASAALVAISVKDIIANCVLVTTVNSNQFYMVKLPNNYEHY